MDYGLVRYCVLPYMPCPDLVVGCLFALCPHTDIVDMCVTYHCTLLPVVVTFPLILLFTFLVLLFDLVGFFVLDYTLLFIYLLIYLQLIHWFVIYIVIDPFIAVIVITAHWIVDCWLALPLLPLFLYLLYSYCYCYWRLLIVAYICTALLLLAPHLVVGFVLPLTLIWIVPVPLIVI